MTIDESSKEAHAKEIERRMRDHGAEGVIGWVRGFPDPADRVQLYSLAQRTVGGGTWDVPLDEVVALLDEAIAESLRQSDAAADAAARDALVNSANVLSYNLSACLADCWPNDARRRERRHLERGLQAAEACLRWREELRKGPFPFSIAWWAKGIHLLALGRVVEAEDAFDRALRHAERHVEAQGGSTAQDATGDWSVLLSEGYRQIASARRTGNRAGFDRVLRDLAAAVVARPSEAEDLQFTADQLRCADARHGTGPVG